MIRRCRLGHHEAGCECVHHFTARPIERASPIRLRSGPLLNGYQSGRQAHISVRQPAKEIVSHKPNTASSLPPVQMRSGAYRRLENARRPGHREAGQVGGQTLETWRDRRSAGCHPEAPDRLMEDEIIVTAKSSARSIFHRPDRTAVAVWTKTPPSLARGHLRGWNPTAVQEMSQGDPRTEIIDSTRGRTGIFLSAKSIRRRGCGIVPNAGDRRCAGVMEGAGLGQPTGSLQRPLISVRRGRTVRVHMDAHVLPCRHFRRSCCEGTISRM